MNFNFNYPKLAREAGFKLRQYKDGPLDWHLLGSFEIERLLRDQNLEDIDRVLVHLSEAPLGYALSDSNILDSGIAKYFIVSQFAIQYLLFCRNFLDETVHELRESHAESQFEIARLKKLLNEANNEILQLHKKMTQMEAIHEVIYPCHLCTKNFANNEALNIHIGRKHKGSINGSNNKPATPTTKEELKIKDLTLINTIKLELEIKHLKERLNIAEKEIKARAADNTASSKPTTPRVSVEVERRNVAIQSNLSEEKETYEAKADETAEFEQAADVVERQAQLATLQEKIYSIEEWRATQLVNNEESIAEIKRRLNDIAQALEHSTITTKTSAKPDNLNENAVVYEIQERKLERHLSAEDLERVLVEKVAEIGKASTEKLTEIVHNMEATYRDKLFELEREVKQATRNQNINQTPIEVQAAPRLKRSIAAASANFEDQIIQITKSEDDEADGTYSIELKDAPKMAPIETDVVIESKTTAQTLSSLTNKSNRTFVKAVDDSKSKTLQKSEVQDVARESFSDTTDISESLTEDEAEIEQKEEMNADPYLESATKVAEGPVKKSVHSKSSKIKRPKSPKKFTRKDAKNLAANRLENCGLDIRMKSLPHSTLKRVNSELEAKRNRLKKTYPNYYATRNRIKKFVDKLCSRKLPEKAEKILKNKTALQPMKASKAANKQTIEEVTTSKETEESSDNDTDAEQSYNRITNEAQQKKEDFKKRLELLLASPMKRPSKFEAPTTSKASATNEESKPFVLTKPMPVPRKRVMFDTASGQMN